MRSYKPKIRKGDNVLVIAGKDRGKTGIVDKVLPTKSAVIVTSVAVVKKHVKPNKKYPSGGIIEKSMPISLSNVIVICPSCGKSTRIGIDKTAKKFTRICAKCKKSINVDANAVR
jgi:large subunit ribosomal protein L24